MTVKGNFKVTDISGERFGRLVAQWPISRSDRGSYKWLFVCDCGNLKVIVSKSVLSGKTQACGCLQRERSAIALAENRQDQIIHGHSGYRCSPTYHSWHGMKQRCGNLNHKEYYCYGAAGVKVCKRWRTFKNFLADMGERPNETTLGRFGDIGNYEPGNCAWMSYKEQAEEKKVKRKLDRILRCLKKKI
jgi:hypothetical protein